MKKTPLASKRIITIFVFTFRLPFYPSKMGISRFCSGFLIFALLLQMLISGPIRTAKASVRMPSTAPITAPPEPFHFQNSLSDVAEPSTLTTTLSSALSNIFTLPTASEGFADNNTLASVTNLAVSGASLFSLTDPAPNKSEQLEPKEDSPESKEIAANPNTAAPSMPTAVGAVTFDFDGDSKADVGRWHPSTHEFKVRKSTDKSYSSTLSLGSSSSKPVPGDFNGDSWADMAVFNPGTTSTTGTWSYLPSQVTNPTPQTIALSGVTGNSSGDIPIAGDFDQDGFTDVGVFRPSNGNWYIRLSHTSTTITEHFGAAGDVPITGDYDGDGTTDIAVYRLEATNSTPPYEYHIHWYFRLSTDGDMDFWWGQAGDIPIEGDFDGGGRSDPTVYRPSEGIWYVATSTGHTWSQYAAVGWGNYGDQPVPADYDGDGKTDYAVWRPKSGVWFILKSQLANPTKPEYLYATLGTAGDTAIPSSYIKQIGVTIPGYDMANARLAPANATGRTNLYSQNFSWGTSLVGLPGRAGLNAGFGISYNSLVWLKHGSTMYFDPDFSNVSPGFRLGFPVIEPVYYDKKKDLWAYMMVTPDGGRKEFRQIAASNQYEAADSSYTQLITTGATSPNDPVENITIKVTSTDGTQMFYDWRGGAFRCNFILDRNGNYIQINHTDSGLLGSVTDTLGRVISVIYNSDLYPIQINQTWKNDNGSGSNSTHTWASFSYATVTVNTNFGNGVSAVTGPPNGTILKVLEKINYSDQSYTKFLYNSYAQVRQIESYAADGHKLNHVRTNLDSVSGVQADCPRFTETDTYAENFNGGQVVRVNNSTPYESSFSGGHVDEPNTIAVDVKTADHPNDLYSRLHFAKYDENAKWKEGLPIATEDCIGEIGNAECSNRQRWTWTSWEQDQVGTTPYEYLVNPRVIETQIGDNSNTKRSTTSYIQESSQQCSTIIGGGGDEPEAGTHVACYGLVDEVNVYDTDLETVKKKSVTKYNLGTGIHTYLSQRIIGLPSQVETWGRNDSTQSLDYVSKVTYGYDEGGYTGSNQSVAPSVGHYNTTYGSGFSLRGNLTSTTRWNVEYPTNSSYAVTSSVKYNTTGSPISQTDPLNRVTRIGYADSFNSTGNPSTYAYPTTLTAPAGSSLGDTAHSSFIKYRYDIGANIEATSPAPAGNTYGKTSKRVFDSLGRIDNEAIYVNTTKKAYTRYEYPTNGIQSKVFSTVVDFNTNGGPDTADEVLSESWFDGAGHVRGSRTDHPGSSGGWSASLTEYDILGRVSRQSVPTEVSVASPYDPAHWTPAGDDNRGTGVWLWTSQKYDWKGRVIRKINTDGDPNQSSNDSDVFISYEGCGCAGGQVTTIRGENIIESDWQGNNQTTLGRRTQRIHEDILGRPFQTDVMNWDGSTVYTTTVNNYDGRDQILNTRQYAGNTSSSTFRDVTMHYDGHGRMLDRHYPIEDTDTKTIWSYNADNSINTVTDPRGVVTTFGYYSSTGLLHTIVYDLPSGLASTVPDTPDVTYQYDSLGNRTSMTDGSGSASYTYNSLSQMTSETKNFTGLSGSYTINYTYTLSGGLKTMGDPQDSTRKVVYNHDKIGRVIGADTQINGSPTVYLHDAKYRAWGDLKEYKYDRSIGQNTTQTYFNFSYDNRLMVSSYDYGQGAVTGAQSVSRFSDGKVKFATTQDSPGFADRSYKYDAIGRVTKGYTGFEANGLSNPVVGPYKQEISYTKFSEVTTITGRNWTHSLHNLAKSYDGTSGREASTGYDAAGNITSERIETIPASIYRSLQYDAAGRNIYTFDPLVHACCENNHTYSNTFDGNGWQTKSVDISTPPSGGGNTSTLYEIRSTVLGGEVVGKRQQLDGNSLPMQFITPVLGGELTFGAIAGSIYDSQFSITGPDGLGKYTDGALETYYDPRGANAGIEPPAEDSGGGYPQSADPAVYTRCVEGGVPVPCDTQSRFDQRANEIGALIYAQWAAQKTKISYKPGAPKAPKGPHMIEDEKRVSTASSFTTITNKPKDNFQKGVAIEPASIPDQDDYPSIGEFSVDVNDNSIVGPFGGWDDLSKTFQGDFATLQRGLSKYIEPPSKSAKLGINQFNDENKDLCEEMVLKPLANIGLDINGFLGYLKNGADFVDWKTSSITVGDALGRNSSPPAASTTLMSSTFAPNTGRFDVITSYSMSQTKLTVFVHSGTAASSVGLLFHEGLHGFGAFLNRSNTSLSGAALAEPFSDDKLKSLFGITGSGSTGITEYIDKYCGTYLNR